MVEIPVATSPQCSVWEFVFFALRRSEAASSTLPASPPAPPRQAKRSGAVADVDREIAALKDRGVVLEQYDDLPGEPRPCGVVIDGGAKAAWFKDSEGNILALIQML